MSKQFGTGLRVATVAVVCVCGLIAFGPAHAVRPADPDQLARLQQAVDTAGQRVDEDDNAVRDAGYAVDSAANTLANCTTTCSSDQDNLQDKEDDFANATYALDDAIDDYNDALDRLHAYEDQS